MNSKLCCIGLKYGGLSGQDVKLNLFLCLPKQFNLIRDFWRVALNCSKIRLSFRKSDAIWGGHWSAVMLRFLQISCFLLPFTGFIALHKNAPQSIIQLVYDLLFRLELLFTWKTVYSKQSRCDEWETGIFSTGQLSSPYPGLCFWNLKIKLVKYGNFR